MQLKALLLQKLFSGRKISIEITFLLYSTIRKGLKKKVLEENYCYMKTSQNDKLVAKMFLTYKNLL